MTRCEQPSIVGQTEPATLPDGRYVAVWHGYYVEFKIGEVEHYTSSIDLGVRGWKPTHVVISGNQCHVE